MKKAVSTICAAAAVISIFGSLGCAAAGYAVFGGEAVFSEDIVFSAKIMGGRADIAYDRMKSVISDIDAQVSLTHDSDLKRFNAADAGVAVEVGKHCYDLFVASQSLYTETDGAFNPAAAPLSSLWHVDANSLSSSQAVTAADLPAPSEVETVLTYCDASLVEAAESDGKYTLKKLDGRVKLDFGGIAKGYAVDRCVEILSEYNISSALLDISGNAYFYGDYIDKGEAKEWHVGINDPRPRAESSVSRGVVCAIETKGGVSAVTSGDYNRYYSVDGARGKLYVPHVIATDGAPVGVRYIDGEWENAEEYVISATVVGESSAQCDALSTAVMALGLQDGARLLQKVGCKGLIFTEKRFTIIGDVALYNTDAYGGYKSYEYVDFSGSGNGL